MTAVLCQCGCGDLAPIARRAGRYGAIPGEARRFVDGHERHVQALAGGSRARCWVVTDQGRDELARIRAERQAALA